MEPIKSSCGLLCNECRFYPAECAGCFKVQGQTFWAKEMMPNKTCPLFDCAVNEKKYAHCGMCNDLPCGTFLQMKDPESTEEEHQEYLKIRVDRLKEM